jgi:hypothetical protein
MKTKFETLASRESLKDIYGLMSEMERNLKDCHAHFPYKMENFMSLELIAAKMNKAKQRLAAEHFIDVKYIEQEIKRLRAEDPQADKFNVKISRRLHSTSEYTCSPYSLIINVDF